VLLLAWFASPLGDWVVHAVVSTIPLSEDVALGLQAVASEQFRYAEDDHGIPALGRRLVAASPELAKSGIPFSFRVIKQEGVVNAFAFPGGPIFVTEELVRQLRATGPELAAVLGHEMGHVIHRHSQQSIVKRQIVPFLLSVLFHADDDDREESFGEATGEMLLRFAGEIGELAFSRANEYEADDVSWQLLLAAGFDPRALRSFFSKLLLLGGSGDSRAAAGGLSAVSLMMSTHPATEERIRMLERRWAELPAAERRRIELRS